MSQSPSSFSPRGVFFASIFILGGCSIMPQPIAEQEQLSIAAADRAAALAEVAPISGPVTLSEALARALKYNLNHRTKMMEEALALGQWDMSRYDMLPKLMAGAGYHWRNNYRITNSTDSVTGLPSLANPYISSDRMHTTTDLGLTWNLLDFGVSFQNAKQNGDKLLVASENRRKAMHLLMQDVTTVYWRAVSAQKIQHTLRETIRLGEASLTNSRRAEREKVRNPVDALRYQRTILENLRVLENIQRELATAKIELAALINLPPGAHFELAEPSMQDLNPVYRAMPVERMEVLAVKNNADLRAEFYNARIAVAETKKAMLRLFPGLSFNYGYKHDSDDYLINSTWREASAQISWNLFNLLAAPSTIRHSKAYEKLAEQKRITTQMAVLSQVHIARQQYEDAYDIFKRADAIWRVDQRIYHHTVNRESAKVNSQMDRVLQGTAMVVSLLRRYQALSDFYAANSQVVTTMGIEPEIDDIQEISLERLTSVMAENLTATAWYPPVISHQPSVLEKSSEDETEATVTG